MRSILACLVAVQFSACSPKQPSTKDAFTLANGVELVTDAQFAQSAEGTRVQLNIVDDNYLILVRAYFNRATAFDQPWVTLTRNGISTLNLGTKGSGAIDKEEILRNVIIRIDKSRIPSGTVLSVYNMDSLEVLANISIP
jgi:hypothetical protein